MFARFVHTVGQINSLTIYNRPTFNQFFYNQVIPRTHNRQVFYLHSDRIERKKFSSTRFAYHIVDCIVQIIVTPKKKQGYESTVDWFCRIRLFDDATVEEISVCYSESAIKAMRFRFGADVVTWLVRICCDLQAPTIAATISHSHTITQAVAY